MATELEVLEKEREGRLARLAFLEAKKQRCTWEERDEKKRLQIWKASGERPAGAVLTPKAAKKVEKLKELKEKGVYPANRQDADGGDAPLIFPKKTENEIVDKKEEILPAQPTNRQQLLEVIREGLRSGRGRGALSEAIDKKVWVDEGGRERSDKELYDELFKRVMDGDERAVIRKYFMNV